MRNNFNILFLSDAHLGNPKHGLDPQGVLLPLIDDIKLMRGKLGSPQLLIFGGDLAFGEIPQSPISKQFEMAEQFLDDVYTALEASPVLTPLLVVPGNHDINRKLIGKDQSLWVSSLKDANVLNEEVVAKSVLWERLLERQKSWKEFYTARIPDQWSFDDTFNLTTGEMDHEGVLIGIAGINSAWSCSSGDSKGSIWIGKHQYQTALNKIKDCDFKIGIWHHPISWLHPIEEQDFRQHVQHDFNLFLHGHEHSQFLIPAKNHLDIASGACYQGSQYKNSYSWICIDFDQGNVDVLCRTYSDEGKRGWIPFVVPGVSDHPLGTASYKSIFDPFRSNAVINAVRGDETEDSGKISTFQELSLILKELLDANHTFFNAFGPNSGANAEGDVRLDLSLWENAKKEVVLPNNSKIVELLKFHKKLIPAEFNDCVQRLIAHAYAFEKHCNNPKISYKDYLFPPCFPAMVSVGLASVADQLVLTEVSTWLSDKLAAKPSIAEAYVFGSVILGAQYAGDVDVAIIHSDVTTKRMLALGTWLNSLNKDFEATFQKSLDFTVFSGSEVSKLSDFMRVAGSYRKII